VATIALAGGGTGGHVYPALAIGEVLRHAGHDLILYGDPNRLEGRVAPQRNVVLRDVGAKPFPRSGGVVGKLRFGWNLLGDVVRMRGQLRRDGVAAVLGVGGYLAAPTVLAGWSLGLPVVVHEANAMPGLANRLCARVADRVLLVFEATKRHLSDPSLAQRVGMPVSKAIAEGDRGEAAVRYGLDPAVPTVLVVGGSLGAARLNDLAIALSAREDRPYQVLHLCGPRFEDDVRVRLDGEPDRYTLVPYEDRMQDAYAMADLVVCRAGSGTLAEVALVGKPALLVPSPHVTDDHQGANAQALVDQGAAVMVREEGWADDAVVAQVEALLSDADRRAAMGEAMGRQAQPEAAAQAAGVVLALLGEQA